MKSPVRLPPAALRKAGPDALATLCFIGSVRVELGECAAKSFRMAGYPRAGNREYRSLQVRRGTLAALGRRGLIAWKHDRKRFEKGCLMVLTREGRKAVEAAGVPS